MDEQRIPKIISVDDHVVEPAHLWQTWLPVKLRDRGPKVVRRGVRDIQFVGAAVYKEVFDDDALPRPTPGCTRTSSTPTSGWSPPSATHATR